MKQILFITFLALGPALADQTRVEPAIYDTTAPATVRAHTALGPIVPVDATHSQEQLAELCQHRS